MYIITSMIRPAKCLLSGAGIFFLLLLPACHSANQPDAAGSVDDSLHALFRLLPPDSTAIGFSNDLTEGPNTNLLLYEYFYNGGGVAVADLNGDGLEDIYFTGNMVPNRIYLNEGHLHFRDITDQTGAGGRPGPWKTGVAIADINADGKPDILVSYSGKVPGYKRIKQLFINQGCDVSGIPHFEDQAARYGLADSAYTTQCYFVDYDHDGDLDLLELNHNPNSLPVLNEALTAQLLQKNDPLCGLRLLRNDQGVFHDVTGASGINGSLLSYGLGAGIADIDGDGWPDIYVSNDYTVPDHFYVNDHHGHFTDKLKDCFGHVSQFSMGNNIADINNDGLPDVYTLDMLPEDNRRQKLLFAPDNYEKFDLTLRSGFYYQYMRNMLQLNNGDGHFSEIGQLAGVSNTDWSWAPLFADFDNDGWKDLFVTNGFVRDYTNMDFIKFMENYQQQKGRMKRGDVLGIIAHMPSSNVTSYLFHNNGDLGFSSMGTRWGITRPSNSNGAAWADLDNDGDLDLIVNNVNQPAFIYENRARAQNGHHFLSIKLQGMDRNTQGLGARLILYCGQKRQYLEQMPVQGYQSTVSSTLHFGLGADSVIDSLRIVWPAGGQELLKNPAIDGTLTLAEKNAAHSPPLPAAPLHPAFEEIAPPVRWSHTNTAQNDYKRQPLLVNPLSFGGPCLAAGDIDGDGLDDLYTGASHGQPAAIFLRQKNGSYRALSEPAFEADKAFTDADALLADLNGDGHLDLYVASGGYQDLQPGDTLLQDRLYLGDGKGHFTRARSALPPMPVAKSVVRAADVNGDGYPDLFVGGRVIPGLYPQTPPSFLLINDGQGHFTDRTKTVAPQLSSLGMVTDAIWYDLNGDKQPDLVLAGEWMPITVLINQHGQLQDHTAAWFDQPCTGWWNKLWLGDLDGDGHPELLAGNLGLNSQCRADPKHPAELYYKDFDANGTLDPILCFYIGDTSYPFMTRDELLQQIGNRSKRFPDYATYAAARYEDVFSPEERKDAGHLSANCLRTCLFSLDTSGRFRERPLPIQAQYAPVFTITPLDYDHDGSQDLLLCGNINHARIRFGKYDASYGTLLHGDGKGHFTYVDQPHAGFHLTGDVRSVINRGDTLLFGVNGGEIKAYRLK